MLGLQLPDLDDQIPEDFEVLKSNAPVLQAFFALDGCAWQYSGMGDLIGLDYQAADIIWTRLELTVPSDVFAGVMLFARTVVSGLLAQRKK
jgi:hypothetical protein